MAIDPQICFKDSAKLQLLETPLLHIRLTSKLGQEPLSIKKFTTVFLKIFESFCLFSGQNLLLLGHMMTHFRGNKKSGYTFKFLENGPFFMRKRNHFNKTCDLFKKSSITEIGKNVILSISLTTCAVCNLMSCARKTSFQDNSLLQSLFFCIAYSDKISARTLHTLKHSCISFLYFEKIDIS